MNISLPNWLTFRCTFVNSEGEVDIYYNHYYITTEEEMNLTTREHKQTLINEGMTNIGDVTYRKYINE